MKSNVQRIIDAYVDELDIYRKYFSEHTKERRKDNFKLYAEPFRPFNKEEHTSYFRANGKDTYPDIPLVSYQALTGGFTICNIIVNGRLFSGSSHCIKSDRWLPIRGKMNAFHRALQSEGVELPKMSQKSTITDSMINF